MKEECKSCLCKFCKNDKCSDDLCRRCLGSTVHCRNAK